MKDFNKVILMGRLSQEPVMKDIETESKKVTNFTIAVNRQWTGSEGQKAEEASFIDCAIFGKRAETIANYFTVGRPILIEGRLKQKRWKDEAGKNRSSVGVVVDEFHFIDKKPENTSAQSDDTLIDDSTDILSDSLDSVEDVFPENASDPF